MKCPVVALADRQFFSWRPDTRVNGDKFNQDHAVRLASVETLRELVANARAIAHQRVRCAQP